tara:strand:- start:462 stop:695 length:234 start_codon:yes stop_codon:yes gene_type:complete
LIISSILAKLLPLVLKEVGKQLSPIKNEIIPIKKYVEEPNQNNVDIAKIKEDIIFIKNELKKTKPNKKTKDKKWYDD